MRPKFVYYINVGTMSKLKAEQHINEVSTRLKSRPEYPNEDWFLIPVRDQESKIELLHL